MGIALKILTVMVGIVFICRIFITLKEKKLSAGQSLPWLLGGVSIILVGIFPSVLKWAAGLLNIWWTPALFLVAAIVLLIFICFNYAREISVMKMQITELTEQLAILKFDLEEKNSLQDKKETEEESL